MRFMCESDEVTPKSSSARKSRSLRGNKRPKAVAIAMNETVGAHFSREPLGQDRIGIEICRISLSLLHARIASTAVLSLIAAAAAVSCTI